MTDKRQVLTTRKSREIERTIYTDWANHHLEKTGVKRLIQDLPKDISDGVLLADIVQFVCGETVERIHSKPGTVKQKLHNIDRCLHVLASHRVVLNDVTVQGIYRGELKCVLALFFHLSRFKQKTKDFKMADSSKTGQRRCLRPPSAVTVSRKSRSFNANDRNRINIDVSSTNDSTCRTTPGSPVNGGNVPQSRLSSPVSSSSATGWRSKSMSAKHTATTRLLAPKTHATTMQTFKPDSTNSNNSVTSHSESQAGQTDRENKKAPNASRLGSPSRLQRSTRKPPVGGSGLEVRTKTTVSTSLPRKTDDKTNKSSLTRPKRTLPGKSVSPTRTNAKLATKSVSPTRNTDRPTSKPTSPARGASSSARKEVDSKATANGVKSTSVISRLRKLGSTTSTSSTTTTTKPRSTSVSKNTVNSVTSPSSTLKKRAESCPPTSRISVAGKARPGFLQKGSAPARAPVGEEPKKSPTKSSSEGKGGVKSPSGLKSVKSTIGKAFGGSKKSPTTPTSKTGGLSKTSNKKTTGISKSEIHPIIPMVTNASEPVQTIHSHTNGTYEVSDKLANVVYTDLPTCVADVDHEKTDSIPINPPLYEKATEPVSISIGSPRTGNKAHKTATVAPFMRQPTPVETDLESTAEDKAPFHKSPSSLSLKRESPDLKSDDSSSLSATTPAEAREMAVKGIADLRHNLEETMSSLRNTQLRHRKGDAFQRRISAQLDGVEFDEINNTAHDISSPLSCSGSLYRSHHNLMSGRTSVRPLQTPGSNSPKLHAGETLGHHADYRFGPGRFSSLQRTRSARYPRTAWREVTPGYVSEGDALATPENEAKGYISDGAILSEIDGSQLPEWENQENLDDASSVSSCDISDYIADVSTDEVSSSNNSPFHQMKTPQTPSDQISTSTWRKLGSGLSKSTMAIETSSKSLKLPKKKSFGKPPSGKTGLRAPGSSVVGSRLACNTATPSPTSGSPVQQVFAQRGTLSYRSLPRPSKSRMHDDKLTLSSPLTNGSPANTAKTSSTFKRSPSLQKLLGFGKSKQSETKAETKTVQSPSVVYSNPHVSNSTARSITTTAQSHNKTSPIKSELSVSPSPSNDITTPPSRRRELGHYNSLGRPSKSPRSNSLNSSPLSYLSLPRRTRTPTSTTTVASSGNTCPISTVMTWSSPKRSNANSAYSISPATSNPFMSLDLLSTPSLYLDEKDNLNYPDAESFMKQTNTADFGRGVSDWPLPTLHSSSNIAASSPNVARAALNVDSKDFSLSTKDLYRGISCNVNEKNPKTNLTNNRSQSAMSSTPSLYSLAEENVVPMKLNLDSVKGENNLQAHLNTNAKVVTAFEQSLSSMNDRLRQLSVSAEEKDSELQDLRATIETLKRNQSPDDWSSNSSGLKKKASCGSLSSISSKTSVSSIGSTEDGHKKKKKHWLRESIKTAFGKRKSRPNLAADFDEADLTAQPILEDGEESDVVAQLKEELLKKERKLTDIRLEALTSQHQLHQMQDAMHRMRNEMETLRQENERLNRLGLSTMSLDMISPITDNKNHNSYSVLERLGNDDTRMTVMVEYPHHVIHDDIDEQSNERRCVLGVCYVARSIGWQQLDNKVKHVFQDYCQKIDHSCSLGLGPDSVMSYSVGEAERHIGGNSPDLLPCGYIVGNVDTIVIKLRDGSNRSVDSLALELLIDKETLDRYVRLVLDNGRVMLCGPTGTGKSTLANRLAEHVVRMMPKQPGRGAIVRLDLKHRNENEIAEYLHQLSEDCSKPESCGRDIPIVLVLDDMHRSSALKEAFIPLLTTAAHSQLPYLIGVAQQDHGSGLQLHHEFRWILCSNHVPPVHDFLERSLRRALLSWETTNNNNADDIMTLVVNWIPKCWNHINKCIETHNSADVTLGPRMFTTCPMDVTSSRVWFTDLWNFSIVPYIISAVKQGSKRGNASTQWIDPLKWVKESWPWSMSCDLLPIRAEDVAIDPSASDDNAPNVTSQSTDPLLNMLLKLQEAAATNYESDTSHDDAFERSLDRALGDLS